MARSGRHCNLRAGAAQARPAAAAACARCRPGELRPRPAHHRDAVCGISATCCFLHCVAGLVRSARIRAVLAANRSAAFPELCMPQHCCRSRRLSRLLHRSGENDKRYRRHHPASRPGAVLPVLILINPNNPILQSCTYPIATAVQPWSAQACAYTFWNRATPAAHCPHWLVEPAMPPARRDSRPTWPPLAKASCDSVFFHRICIQARPMETPLCKISF